MREQLERIADGLRGTDAAVLRDAAAKLEDLEHTNTRLRFDLARFRAPCAHADVDVVMQRGRSVSRCRACGERV